MSDSDKEFLKALRGEETKHIPFWFMRQAGRYLPEYRELRASSGGFLDMAYNPDRACEITMQPIRRFGMGAAIIFSDILTVPHALGQDLQFVQGEGPKLGELSIDGLSFSKFEEFLQPVYDAISQTRSRLGFEKFDGTALVGFSGAPWTVATYMVEGGSSRDFLKVKTMAYGHPKKFGKLIDILVDATSEYLIKQVDAGAEALQIFDSWAGVLDQFEFQKWAVEPARKIVERVKAVHPEIKIIGFPKGAGLNYVSYVRETGVDAIQIDPSVPTDWARDELQGYVPVQGNLDPLCLLAGGDMLENAAGKILEDLKGGPYIFNLGHGIHKDTPIEHVEELIKIIRDA